MTFNNIDESKLSENELILNQARQDCLNDIITPTQFNDIKIKHGNHIKITKKEYFKLPLKQSTNMKYKHGMIFRVENGDVEIGDWKILIYVKTINEIEINLTSELCEVI